MPREPKLDMFPDKPMAISGNQFRKIVRRIESIVPIAGERIKVEPVDDGHKITAEVPELKIITLNVCSNGVPDTIDVYGPPPDLESFGV